MSVRYAPAILVQLIKANGQVDDTLDFTTRVLSLDYQDSEKKTDLLKLSLENSDLAMFDSPVMTKGTKLRVAWGYVGNLCPPRDCVVTKASGSLTLAIEAQDKGCLLHKKTKSRTFDGMRRSDVVHQIAVEFGYTGTSNVFIDDTEVVLPHIVQAAQTDAQFLKKLADVEGYEFYIDFDGFHWHRRRTEQRPHRKLSYFLPPRVGDILSFNVEADAASKPSSVTTAGRNSVDKKDINETANAGNTARTTTSTNADLKDQPNGQEPITKIDRRTGEQTTVYPPTPTNQAATGAAGNSDVRATSATTSAEARREATGIYNRSQQAAVMVTFNIVGDPLFLGKTVIEVEGLGKRLSGRFYVSEVNHKVSSSGYSISFKGKTEGGNDKTAGLGKAKPNKKDAPPDAGGAPQPLQAVTNIDRRTGEVTTVYVDAKGKELASDKAAK